MKRNNKIDDYHKYFDTNKNKGNKIHRKDIKLLNGIGNAVSDPKKIVDLFNK